MPVFISSSRQSVWREVSPERAIEASASAGGAAASRHSTVGAGTASTEKGPVMRTCPGGLS